MSADRQEIHTRDAGPAHLLEGVAARIADADDPALDGRGGTGDGVESGGGFIAQATTFETREESG